MKKNPILGIIKIKCSKCNYIWKEKMEGLISLYLLCCPKCGEEEELEEIKEKYEDKYKIQTILMDEAEFRKRKKEALVQEIMKSGINIMPE